MKENEGLNSELGKEEVEEDEDEDDLEDLYSLVG